MARRPKRRVSTIPPLRHIIALGQLTAHLLITGIFAFPIAPHMSIPTSTCLMRNSFTAVQVSGAILMESDIKWWDPWGLNPEPRDLV